VATFSDLVLSTAGAGYTLVVSRGTLTADESNPFDVL
jgi:hypothetical protein